MRTHYTEYAKEYGTPEYVELYQGGYDAGKTAAEDPGPHAGSRGKF